MKSAFWFIPTFLIFLLFGANSSFSIGVTRIIYDGYSKGKNVKKISLKVGESIKLIQTEFFCQWDIFPSSSSIIEFLEQGEEENDEGLMNYWIIKGISTGIQEFTFSALESSTLMIENPTHRGPSFYWEEGPTIEFKRFYHIEVLE